MINIIKNVDKDIIKILLSKPSLKQIRLIQKSIQLNNNEKTIIDKYILSCSVLDNDEFKQLRCMSCKELGLEDNFIPYTYEELYSFIYKFIDLRRKTENETIIKMALDESLNDNYVDSALNIINSRYITSISSDDNNKALDDLDNYSNLMINEFNNDYISSQVNYIDEISIGIPVGRISSIVDIDGISSHIFINNIAYKNMIGDHNVLYFSFKKEKINIYLEIISRHSYEDQYRNKISYGELKTKFDEKLYSSYRDELLKYFQSNLLIYDDNDINILNDLSLRAKIIKANNTFIEKTGKPIELIIIDGLSFMRVDTRRSTIVRTNYVEETYYALLKRIANDYSVPVIITTVVNPTWKDKLNEGVYHSLKYISDIIKNYSSMIIGLKVYDVKSKRVELSVLKSLNDTVINNISIFMESDYSYVEKENENDSVESNIDSNSNTIFNEEKSQTEQEELLKLIQV